MRTQISSSRGGCNLKKVLLSSLLVGSLSVAAVAPTFASVPTDMTIKQMTTGHGIATTTTRTNVMNGNGVDLNPFDTNGTGTRIGNDVRNGINDVGRGINDVGNDVRSGMNRTFGTYGTGTYGTGTYSPNGTNVTNNGYGTYDRTRMNAYSGTGVHNNLRTNTYRTRATTTTNRGFSWGWLGLLGLFGLAGMRSRSREDVR